jgi:glutamate dehydrogenase
LTVKTDFPISSFPDYVDPFTSSDETVMDSPTAIMDSPTAVSAASRLVAKIKGEEAGRHPSPQPTHVSYSNQMPKVNGNGHRVLRSATVGYVAPEFTGKLEQMKLG